MKLKKIFLFSIFLFLPIFCLGQIPKEIPPGPSPGTPVGDYVYWLYKVLLWGAAAASFFSLIIAGLKFIIAVGDPAKLEDARNQAIMAIIGLLFVILIPTILGIITNDPQFKIENFFKTPGQIKSGQPGEEPSERMRGVYLYYKEGEDPKEKEMYLNRSIPKLSPGLVITRVEIVGSEWGVVLFDGVNYKGGYCHELSTGSWSVPEDRFIISIAIYTKASGSALFYRKTLYNKNGGWASVSTEWQYLEDKKFSGVPEDEKKCKKWDKYGNCIEKETPTLAGSCIKRKNGECEKYNPNDGINSFESPYAVLIISKKGEEIKNLFCQLFPGSIPSLKNEYIRRDEREPSLMKVLGEFVD